jgi:oligo-1,6-glucosidase
LIEEVKNILRFYLNKGVYGFRCDVINQIYKTSLEDGKFRFFNRGKEHYESQPMNHVILKRLQDEVLSEYDSFLVGETSNITPEIGREFLNNKELDLFFEFDHSMCDMNKLVPIFKKKFKPRNLIKPMFKWQDAVDWIGIYLENHDQRRSVTRYGNEDKYHAQKPVPVDPTIVHPIHSHCGNYCAGCRPFCGTTGHQDGYDRHRSSLSRWTEYV